MNIVSIIFLLYASLSTVFSIKPKICLNCKYIMPLTRYSWSTNEDQEFSEFSTCSFFPKYNINKSNYLVTGVIEESNTEYYYCSTAREQESMCGEKGKEYKKKSDKKNSDS